MYFIRINSISYVYFRSRCTHGQTSENEQPYNHHIEYWSIIHGFVPVDSRTSTNFSDLYPEFRGILSGADNRWFSVEINILIILCSLELRSLH